MKTSNRGNGKSGKAQELSLEREELTRALGKARSARERLDLLISSKHAQSLLRSLPAEELYFTIKELGLSDAREIVQLASPAQFRAFVDLDVWRRDRLDASLALTWIRLARSDEDDARYRKKLAALDLEVLELLLKRMLRIHDLSEDEDPDVHGPAFPSPEGRYVVEFLAEGSDYAGIRGLLDDLYAEDPFRAARLLESVRWELPTELEEIAYRWRTARMADLGFPEVGEALSYYAYVDPDQALPEVEGSPALEAGFFLSRLTPGRRFLDGAAALVPDESRALVERQLVTVVNAAMVVEGVDPGETEQVAKVLEAARDTLSLGLEHAARGDPARGAQLLVGAPLKRAFQVGASLGLKLKFRADRLMKSGRACFPGVRGGSLYDPPLGEIVAGLRRKRPLYCEALDGAEGPGLRPLREKADVARLEQALCDAENLAAIFERLGLSAAEAERAFGSGSPPDALALLRFSDLLLTAMAHALVGEEFKFSPLAPVHLPAWTARALALEGGEARPSRELDALLSERLEFASRELGPQAQRAARGFAHLCLRRVEEEAGRPLLAAGKLDPAIPLPIVVG
jgi:hypothetical protein